MEFSIMYAEVGFVCVAILILLSVKVKTSMFLQEQRRLFFLLGIVNALFFILDSIWVFIDHNNIGLPLSYNWSINVCYYILSGVLGYIYFIYSETVQKSPLVRNKKYHLVTLIPVGILILLTLISIKTGWLFYIDNNNVYHRGPAYVLQLITAYGYILFTALKAFILAFHTLDYSEKRKLFILSSFVIPTLISGALQIIAPGYPILCIGNTLGILYIYLTLQEELISIDPLTKLNNRNQLYAYLSHKLHHLNPEYNLYLLIMDIDYFKSINDQYGHVEGDRALQKIGQALMKACHNNHDFICRYGGDEFIVISEIYKEQSVEDVCQNIHNYISFIETDYALTLSIGYAKYDSSLKNQQEFIAKADQELYKIKKARSHSLHS